MLSFATILTVASEVGLQEMIISKQKPRGGLYALFQRRNDSLRQRKVLYTTPNSLLAQYLRSMNAQSLKNNRTDFVRIECVFLRKNFVTFMSIGELTLRMISRNHRSCVDHRQGAKHIERSGFTDFRNSTPGRKITAIPDIRQQFRDILEERIPGRWSPAALGLVAIDYNRLRTLHSALRQFSLVPLPTLLG